MRLVVGNEEFSRHSIRSSERDQVSEDHVTLELISLAQCEVIQAFPFPTTRVWIIV